MEPSAPSLDRLIERLDSDWHLTRKAAMLQAASLPLEQLEQMLLMAAVRKRHQRRRASKYVAIVLACGLILSLLIGSTIHQQDTEVITLMLATCLVSLLIFIVALPKHQYAHTAMMDICISTKEPRFAGTALTRLHRLKQSTTLTAETYLQTEKTSAALIAMLKNISAANPPALTSEQHAFLLTLLCQDVELTRAAIYALPYIGRESALPFVVKVRENRYMPLDLHRDADTCYTRLRERLAEDRQAQSLLRASSIADIAAPDVLLRPADAQPAAAPPEQLLRAAVGEE